MIVRSCIMCFDVGALERIHNSPCYINPQGPQNRGRLRALIEGP